MNLQCFVLNMDRSTERLETCTGRLREAGFTNIERFRGIDGSADDLEKEWEKHGSPKFYDWDKQFIENKGKQGCALGHYGIWKQIIDNKIEYAIIFEDDIQFHKYWNILAPEYWKVTPKDFHVLFFGSQLDSPVDPNDIIISSPVYCTHAYMISLEGAKILYDLCINCPIGTYTIDGMLFEYMAKETPMFKSYKWNGKKIYDQEAHKNSELAKKIQA